MEVSQVGKLETLYGLFNIQAFRISNLNHIAMWLGNISSEDDFFIRPQSACITSTSLNAIRCDCKIQSDMSLEIISNNKIGLYLYLEEEGRGHGILEKINALSRMNNGYNTITSLEDFGKSRDLRNHEAAVIITEKLVRSKNIKLLTNNPDKVTAFKKAGFNVDRISIEAPVNDKIEKYLSIKKNFMGHVIKGVQ